MDATIGALRVLLGADTAAFERGLKGANASLATFGKRAAVAGAAVATALAGAAVAMGIAVRNTLKTMDGFAKASQKIGVPVKELSALTHAADLSGVSFESLTGSLGKLSRSMSDAALGAAKPQQAYDRLGISVQKADGTLKSSTEVLSEVADRFAVMQDGAAKTALAMQLFGRSGAELIPMLNLGASGIEKLKREAEALGITLSTESTKAAEQFNDALDVLGKVWKGFIVQVSEAVAGPLADFAEALRQSAVDAGGLKTAGEKTGDAIVDLAFKVLRATGEIRAFAVAIAGALEAANQFTSFDWTAGQATLARTKEEVAGIRKETEGFIFAMETAAIERQFAALFGVEGNAEVIDDLAAKTRGAASAQRELSQAMAEGQSVFSSTRTPLEAYRIEIENLSRLLNTAAIDAETFGRAQMMAAASAAQPWLQVASTIGGALGQLFDDNKAVAIAQAIINTAQGITAALAQYPPPLSFAMAAAQAAAGAAQIATIKSTKPGSGGSVRRPNAGGGRGSSVSNDRGGTSEQAVHITLVGRSFSREEVRELITGINEAVGDGARLSVTPA